MLTFNMNWTSCKSFYFNMVFETHFKNFKVQLFWRNKNERVYFLKIVLFLRSTRSSWRRSKSCTWRVEFWPKSRNSKRRPKRWSSPSSRAGRGWRNPRRGYKRFFPLLFTCLFYFLASWKIQENMAIRHTK